MRLPADRRSLLATFEDERQAKAAASALMEAGLEDVQVDRVSRHPGEGTDRRLQPLSGRIESLATLTLGADIDTPDEGAALSADPSASGLSAGPGPDAQPYLLTARVPAPRLDEARAIVKRYGGKL